MVPLLSRPKPSLQTDCSAANEKGDVPHPQNGLPVVAIHRIRLLPSVIKYSIEWQKSIKVSERFSTPQMWTANMTKTTRNISNNTKYLFPKYSTALFQVTDVKNSNPAMEVLCAEFC